MTRLMKTDLPASDKVELAMGAHCMQGIYGGITKLSQSFHVSRQTVYNAGASAVHVLEKHFEWEPKTTNGQWVWVDDAQIKRAVIAEAVMSPTGLRVIAEKLCILYPGVKPRSYGTIQNIVAKAEEHAAQFNRSMNLSKITDVALDEMFSQGDPVLAGVDLDSGYLFLLSQEMSRKAKDWQFLLKACKDQKLNLKVVVKDAARGISAGVNMVFPDAEQRDDCFHALFKVGKECFRLAKRAYAAIRKEDEVAKKYGEGDELEHARERAAHAIHSHDQFEQAARCVKDGIECVDLNTGHIRTASEMQEVLEKSSLKMKSLQDEQCSSVGTYIKNRAPGLAVHMNKLNDRFGKLIQCYGKSAVEDSVLIFRLFDDLKKNKRPWSRRKDEKRLVEIVRHLRDEKGDVADVVLNEVQKILERRNRASSAIEGFNAALRPHLYVHKCVTQGFLDLFQAYFNLRQRKWGRFKGTSAYGCLTGKPTNDWLSLLGYPPSQIPH